ncbi:probable LRR receptor-like serine/threonine-protein kinase At1g29720 isoform X4 [Arachis ipaensis]|uniref:probable LRR receptor-like serine/threonine-protein kinase At1g29720 isoform X4 n=1 Tax=Arachis ipaensis TaxID=130454 RepID=UPI000A2B237E|nr:probable LRR receptor-like serine/threonine-protein kinase At1g29720 isoform X4 [Arachis ipaensis]
MISFECWHRNVIRNPWFRVLSSNNFTGELPATVANLSYLQYIKITGSGLSGPIPSGISKLSNLSDWGSSDLSGSEISSFPELSTKSMKCLILRSSNIHGTL